MAHGVPSPPSALQPILDKGDPPTFSGQFREALVDLATISQTFLRLGAPGLCSATLNT